MKTPLITDSQSLISAKSRFGHVIPIYDDGFGALFIHRDSMGISGIVRAKTWEDAYEICEDEFFPEASETVDELRAEYNFTREHLKMIHPICSITKSIDYSITRKAESNDYPLRDGQFVEWKTVETPCTDETGWTENALFCEAYGFRPNGVNSKDVLKHGIYVKDLNGDSLDSLTPEMVAEMEIVLQIEESE